MCDRQVAICMMCGSPQCHGNGLGRGQCSLCYVGLLPGWSGSIGKCSYARCGKPAVARGRGHRMVCKSHAEHQGIGTPDLKDWVLVE